MKQLLTCFLLAISFAGFSQNSARKPIQNQMEITSLVRYDWYPEFSYNYAGRVSTDYLKMQGLSWGINGYYKKALTSSFYFKVGIGYYRYSFTKLINQNRWGNSEARNIAYPSDVYILYSTDKYGYNTLSGNLGIEQLFPLTKSVNVVAGINLLNYYTISRQYNILPNDVNFTVHRKGYLGYSADLSFGMAKQVGRLIIRPSVIIPVYDRWSKDKQFGEDESESRTKWSRGVGVGIAFSRMLKN